MKIKIVHLYPDLLNLYGDLGNIESLRHRLEWRGIEVEVASHTSKDGDLDLSDADIVYLGGGADREEYLASECLVRNKKAIAEYVEGNGVFVATCGGFCMLGKYYMIGDERVEGPGILDIYTERGAKVSVGDVVIGTELTEMPVVGFENHVSKTYIGNLTPLGKVICGNGNNEDGTEGVVYKNVFATNLHGPLLPKNPQLTDYILDKAIRVKNPDFEGLSPLADDLESDANAFIVRRCGEKNKK